MTKPDRYSGLAPYYDIFIDWEKRLALEIPFLLQAFEGPAGGARALDLGCGTGRHLEALGRAGLRAEGAEPSPELRRLARRSLPGAQIHSSKMEELGKLAADHGPWRLVTCLGNTLAHLPPAELPGFFRGLAAALDRPGAAVIHLLGYEKILSLRQDRLPSKTATHGSTVFRFERRYSYREDFIEFTIEVWENEIKLAEDREIIYPLTSQSLAESAVEAGLDNFSLYAGFNTANPYRPDSDNLVAVIRKIRA